MSALPTLSPLPGLRDGNRPGPDAGSPEGFVDETALHRLLAALPADEPAGRPWRTAVREELVAAADESDYAGWQAAPAGRGAEPVFFVPPGWCAGRFSPAGALTRPRPPEFASRSRPVSGDDSSRRWWLAVAGGALLVALVAVLLLALASRHPFFTISEPLAVPPASDPAAESPALPAAVPDTRSAALPAAGE